MKVYLINDTSSCHAGSVKVMENLRKYITDGGHKIIAEAKVSSSINKEHIDNCDLVVVNGEGTLHHNARWAIKILDAMAYAQTKGKMVYLLNALYESMNDKFLEVIKRCDRICAREIYSLYNLGDPINSNLDIHPDFCALNIKDAKPIGGINGGIYKTQTHHAAIYKNCLTPLKYPNCSIGHKTSFDGYVETYKKMDVVVTGQHHAVYAAFLADTPVVPTFGNSHKIESFLSWMKYPVMVCSDHNQVKEEIKKTQDGVYDEAWKESQKLFKYTVDKLDKYLKNIFSLNV